ncbi:helix-turn-helix transcriptional regulator [Photobacterium damselae subsp. piscicida]|nr:helix-turn-helix transcriptional regulator [Photobacterium damselae subsp. piscicida]MDP2559443.1 helix-turn-helix transcriptional regulator [Photobacterium damselae subsp. piscicida]MDP2570231.1 helix-turn-helix transcriptional regulator [Photobacterium damselae subsp. piscicida]
MEYLERIKRLAKIQGISQKQLGEALGLQQGTMSRKLSGKYGIEVRELETIATTLNTSIGYILTGQVDTGLRQQQPLLTNQQQVLLVLTFLLFTVKILHLTQAVTQLM